MFLKKLLKKIKLFLILFYKHKEYYCKDKSALPDEVLKEVSGENLFHDEGISLLPILDSDNQDIVETSKTFIQKSNQAYSQEYRIMQRQNLRCKYLIILFFY